MLKKLVWGGENQGTVRVDDFPSQPPLLFTIGIFAQNVAGTVVIQASIYQNPTEDQWFNLHTETFVSPGYIGERVINRYANYKGRFINMRATVNITQGRVDRIIVN